MLQMDGPATQGWQLSWKRRRSLGTTDNIERPEANEDPLAAYHDEPEPMFEPTEDRELKGPLDGAEHASP